MRQRSLKVDKNDEAALATLYGGNDMNMDSEFGQHVPMFLNREGCELDYAITGQYRGASIFFICNGPSFVKLNHDMLRKPGVMTFGINNGPKTFRPNFWTSVDDPSRFLKSIWLDPKITKFIPHNHFERPIFDNQKWEPSRTKVGECPNVIGYRRNEKFQAERFLKEHTLNWGCHKDHGGGRSVMLPALRIMYILGFRKVYLLGCDMNMTENYAYHFDEQRSKGAVNCNMGTYKRLENVYLPQLKPIFEQAGFQVFNCNPDSNLKVFPFMSFEEAIDNTTRDLGDVPNERVWGMYSKPEEKMKWIQEPTTELKPHLETLGQLKEGHTVSKVLSAPRQNTQPIYVKDDCDPNTNTPSCNNQNPCDEAVSPNMLIPQFRPIPKPRPPMNHNPMPDILPNMPQNMLHHNPMPIQQMPQPPRPSQPANISTIPNISKMGQ